MKHALIFDLDGTLVDSLPGIAASLNCSLAEHGLPIHSESAIRTFVGDGLLTLIERAAAPHAESEQIHALVNSFKTHYETTWANGSHPYPGIHNLMDELQKNGFQLAVLSNKTHDFTTAMVRTIFPKINFAKVLGQRDGIRHKPDPAGAFQIAESLGMAPENCILIGDSTIDLETAANANMKAIAVTWGYHDRARLIASGATLLADDPSELAALFGQIDGDLRTS